jgi:hypothetical protein
MEISNSEYNNHFEWLEHWERYDRHNFLAQRLRILVTQANWNKRVICGFYLTPNDLEIHRNRFGRFIAEVDTIAKEMANLRVNYDEKRMNRIIKLLTIIKNYDNEKFKNS